jgi:hypothetical protein
MILQDKVVIKLTNRNRKRYKNMGYSVSNKEIEIDIKDLSLGSNIKISVSCDICNTTLSVTFYNYHNYKKNYDIYTCKKCSIRHKTKRTKLERYGDENYNNIKKISKTNLEKYGYRCPLQSDIVNKKTKKTSLEKYGVEIPCTSESAKLNRKETNLEKYGVENVFQSIKIIDKIIAKKIENGIITENDSSSWVIYKKQVRKLTEKNKKELYNTWNGFDYYDNEHISENYKLHHNNKNYPTIDHKISVFYGFHNGLLPESISRIGNLVITKRSINSSKNIDNSYSF